MPEHAPLVGVIVLLGAIPALLFPVLYAWKSNWWGNPGGRLIMSLSCIIALFYGILVVYAVWGRDIFLGEQWYDVFRVVVVTFTTAALWYQLLTYIRIAFPRKDKKRGR